MPTPHENTPGRLPNLPGHAGELPRRSAFLGGDIKTFFGPGQPRTAVDPDLDYAPPDDWPAAGSLLRAPQVAWLTPAQLDPNLEAYSVPYTDGLYILYWDNTDPFESGGSTFYGSLNTHWNDGFVYTATLVIDEVDEEGAVSVYHYDYPPGDGIHAFDSIGGGEPILHGDDQDPPALHDTGDPDADDAFSAADEAHASSVPNPQHAEYARIASVFASVAATLGEIRPGRTWAMVIDPATTTGSDYSVGPQSLHAVAPPPSRTEPTFYGTDFLHVYTGGYSPHGVTANSAYPVPSPGEFFEANSIAWLTAAGPRFAGYLALLYGQSEPYGELEPVPPIPLPDDIPYSWEDYDPQAAPPDATYGFSYRKVSDIDDSPWHEGDPGTWHAVTLIEDILGWNDDRADAVVAINGTLAGLNDAVNGYFSAFGVTYADLGFRFHGDSSALTAEALLAIIASHYGFDPETGLDLPPP